MNPSPKRGKPLKGIFPPVFLLPFLFILPVSKAQAQGDWCGSDERHEKKIKEFGKERWETRIDQVFKKTTPGRAGQNDTIPVVVHVIHEGEEGNISYEQIKDGMRVMNEDFNRRNPDTTETRPIFDSLAANTGIVLRLARYGPNGNCTNGITRTHSELTHNADDAVKELIRWPTDEYMNIWLANNLSNSQGQGTLLGYAEFPWWGGTDEDYGVVMRNDRFGTIGTAVSEGRTATHEVGHCLGLLHPFYQGCGGDCSSSGDRVCDTPPTKEETFGCSHIQNTCSSDTVGPSPYNMNVVDQIENYMSYDQCQNMFSKGQKNVMKSVLSNVGGLKRLTSTENLKRTGVHKTPLCKADLKAEKRIVCSGQKVQFRDRSYHGIEERTWTFHKGTPFFVLDSTSPKVSYKDPGLYDVELEVQQGNKTLAVHKKDLIRVLDAKGVAPPYKEDMEGKPIQEASVLPMASSDGMKWGHTDRAGASGSSSLLLENYYATDGREYEFQTRTIDASNMNEVALSFKVAYRRIDPNDDDQLKVYASKSCNNVWDIRKTLDADDLTNGSPKKSYFKDPGPSDWKTLKVEQTLSFGYNVEGLRFKFQFISDGGNNIYIDDINVADASVLSVEEKRERPPFEVTLHPNPASEHVQIRLKGKGEVEHRLKDASGRTLRTGVFEGNGKLQEHELSVETLSSGLYFLHFKGKGGGSAVKKLMVR